MSPSDLLDIVTKVQSFYDAAWTRLVWVIGVAIVFVGIVGAVMPLIIQWIQGRTFHNETRKIEDEAEKRLAETVKQLEKKIEERMAAATFEIRRVADRSFGMTHMVQARLAGLNKIWGRSLGGYAVAANALLDAHDYDNFNRCIESIRSIFSKDSVNKSEFQGEEEESINASLKALITNLSDKKHEERYDRLVEEIKVLWDAAKERETKG